MKNIRKLVKFHSVRNIRYSPYSPMMVLVSCLAFQILTSQMSDKSNVLDDLTKIIVTFKRQIILSINALYFIFFSMARYISLALGLCYPKLCSFVVDRTGSLFSLVIYKQQVMQSKPYILEPQCHKIYRDHQRGHVELVLRPKLSWTQAQNSNGSACRHVYGVKLCENISSHSKLESFVWRFSPSLEKIHICWEIEG